MCIFVTAFFKSIVQLKVMHTYTKLGPTVQSKTMATFLGWTVKNLSCPLEQSTDQASVLSLWNLQPDEYTSSKMQQFIITTFMASPLKHINNHKYTNTSKIHKYHINKQAWYKYTNVLTEIQKSQRSTQWCLH